MRLDLSLSKLDKILLGVSATVALAATAALITASYFNAGSLGGDGENHDTSAANVAGRADKVRNDIRRKAKSSLGWSPLADKSEIYYNESVYSGNDSEVYIVTSRGNTLHLEPNSLVYLEKTNDQVSIDIKLGGLQAELKQGESLVLKNEGSSTLVKSGANNTKVQLQKNADQQSVVILKSGQADATVGDKAQALENQKKLTVDPFKKTAEVITFDIQLMQPLQGETLSLKADAAAILRWKTTAADDSFSVMVSKKRNFADPVFNSMTKDNFARVPDLKNGVYYWKVFTATDLVGSVGTFWVKRDLPPQLAYPGDRATVYTYTPQLFWENPGEQKNFRIQVALDAKLTKSIVNERTDKLDFDMKALAVGTYYWRVLADDSGATLSSPVRSFEVQAPKAQNLNPEQLRQEAILEEKRAVEEQKAKEKKIAEEKIKEEERQKEIERIEQIEIEAKANAEAAAAAEAALKARPPITPAILLNSSIETMITWNADKNLFEPPISFNWTKVEGAENYIFRLTTASDLNFSKVIVKNSLSQNTIAWPKTQPGDFLWSVTSVRETEQKESAIGRATLRLKTPEITISSIKCKPMPAACPQAEVKIDQSIAPGMKLKLEVSAAPDFSSIAQTTNLTESPTKLASLPERSYFARASFYTQDDKVMSSVSSVVAFKIEREVLPGLIAPVLIIPQDRIGLVLFENKMNPLLFQWEPVEDAQIYLVQLSANKSFKPILREYKTKSPNFILKNKPDSTEVFWRVQGITKFRESTWSEVRSFQFEK